MDYPYSVNLLGPDGSIYAGQDLKNREAALAVYRNPENHFTKTELEGVTSIIINVRHPKPQDPPWYQEQRPIMAGATSFSSHPYHEHCSHSTGAAKEIETIEYTLFIYWASYLINGDASGLEDGEQAEIDAYLESEGNPEMVDCSEHQWFARSNDASMLGGDVCTYTAIFRGNS